jgi:hypothetical protein
MGDAEVFRLVNRTRNCVVCDALRLVDLPEDDLKQQLDGLATNPGMGLWIRPCVGAPPVEDTEPFDLVGIDQHLCVVEQFESFQPGSFVLFKSQTTSAIMLARNVIASTGLHAGDELELVSAEKEFVPQSRSAAVHRPELAAGPEPAVAASTPPPAVMAPSDAEFPVEERRESMGTRMMRWLAQDRRIEARVPMPNLVAYRKAAGRLLTYVVEDISKSGIYLITAERPLPGTVFPLTLQKSGKLRSETKGSLAVYVKVLRWGPDGLGLEFVTASEAGLQRDDLKLEGGASREQLHTFVESVKLDEA